MTSAREHAAIIKAESIAPCCYDKTVFVAMTQNGRREVIATFDQG
jgi:hypothetical protein